MWISNEFVAQIILEKTDITPRTRDVIIISSGGLFLIMSVFYFMLFKLDPIDHDIIINEQAINLTSRSMGVVSEAVPVKDIVASIEKKQKREKRAKDSKSTIKTKSSKTKSKGSKSKDQK